MSRRTFLFLLAGLVALLGAFDFGRHGATRPALPPGWKTVRWEAGFGSWCCGGYGVAYEISIPENYVFDQKCGTAWINADTDEGHDFLIKLVFDPGRKFSDSDFDNFMKSDVADAASGFGKSKAGIAVGRAQDVIASGQRFARYFLTLEDANVPSDGAGSTAVARGFRLKGDPLQILAVLEQPERSAVDERIVQTIRPVRGYGLFELVRGSVAGLVGC